MSRLRVVAAIGLAALAVGAVGCGGGSATSRLYVLAPMAAPAAATDTRPVTIGVGPVRLPAYVDRNEIVTRVGPEQIEVSDFHVWGEPLENSVPRTLAANLSALMPRERVALYPWTGSRAVQYQVVVDVARFDGSLGGPVVLGGSWRIIGPERRDLVERRFSISEPSGEPTYTALVAAMSRAIAALSRDIAGALEAR